MRWCTPLGSTKGAAVRKMLLFLFVVLACAGCRPKPIEIDQQRFAAEVERRAALALTKPEVEKGFDALGQALLADPAVSKAGEQLLSVLAADPTLKPGFEALLGKLTSQPAMKRLALKLMRENPRAGPDKIGELTSQRVASV